MAINTPPPLGADMEDARKKVTPAWASFFQGIYSAAMDVLAGVGVIQSVNGITTSDVVLDPDDLSDTSTTHKFTTAGSISKLSGIEAGAEVNNISDANVTDLTDAGATTLHKHDHGGQDGLSDNDHPQYALLADVPNIKQTLSLTAQTAAIGTTAITGTNTAGLYRVSYSLLDTTADLTAGTIMVNILGTDEAGAFTMSSIALPLTALGRTQGSFFLRISSTGSVSYSTTLVGIIGTSQYALFLAAEKIL